MPLSPMKGQRVGLETRLDDPLIRVTREGDCPSDSKLDSVNQRVTIDTLEIHMIECCSHAS